MDHLKSFLKSCFKDQKSIIGLISYHNITPFPSHTDAFDLLVVVVAESKDITKSLFHYIKEGYRIQERWISPADLELWLFNRENRNIIYWILQGEILLDQGTYLESLRHRLLEFPELFKEQKLLMEFSLFLSKFIQSKEYLAEGHYLDAYSSILESLQHWARIVIIEEDNHPELTVWRQVRLINPGVYKLYEELTLSSETLRQRVELVILACEFSVMSKMKSCCKLLLRILEERNSPWSVDEIQAHVDLKHLRINVSLLLDKLVKKSLIREVAVSLDDTFSELELRYTS
ncbi:MAG: nucleotidyltransferase-like protein [Paenibacillaceae bacterium]